MYILRDQIGCKVGFVDSFLRVHPSVEVTVVNKFHFSKHECVWEHVKRDETLKSDHQNLLGHPRSTEHLQHEHPTWSTVPSYCEKPCSTFNYNLDS